MPACVAISSTESSSSVRVASISTPSAINWARRAAGSSRFLLTTCGLAPVLSEAGMRRPVSLVTTEAYRSIEREPTIY